MRLAPAALLSTLLATACEPACDEAGSIRVGGETYCGTPCAACADCPSGFSCQRRSGRGVCVDHAFLRDRGLSSECVDPCPTGEARYDDMGTEVCVRVCTVDGECEHCCVEPSDIEFRICAPRPELCR
jgi:hypothetical protein